METKLNLEVIPNPDNGVDVMPAVVAEVFEKISQSIVYLKDNGVLSAETVAKVDKLASTLADKLQVLLENADFGPDEPKVYSELLQPEVTPKVAPEDTVIPNDPIVK